MKTKAIILEKSNGGLMMECLPIDVERAKELFYLDETSQSFLSWKKIEKSNHMKVGDRAGSYNKLSEYWHVQMDGKLYQVSRIVKAIDDNEDPGPVRIDHIDRNTKNNNPNNLRKATVGLNGHNCGKRKTMNGKTPTSKYPGVSYHKATGKWQAQIQDKGEKIYLGLFETELEAYEAYKAKKKEIMSREQRESLAL